MKTAIFPYLMGLFLGALIYAGYNPNTYIYTGWIYIIIAILLGAAFYNTKFQYPKEKNK